MIFNLFVNLFLSLLDFIVGLIPNVDIDLGFDFFGVLSNVYRYAGIIVHVPILLAMWVITMSLDHTNFLKKLVLFIKSFVPGE